MLERTRADGRPQSAEYKLASRVEAKIDVTQPQSTFAENFPLRHASRSDVLLSVFSKTSQICQETTYFGTRPISAQARHAASPGNARCPVQGDYGPRAATVHRDRRDRHVCYARARRRRADNDRPRQSHSDGALHGLVTKVCKLSACYSGPSNF
mgnify:CR=1 FL=1